MNKVLSFFQNHKTITLVIMSALLGLITIFFSSSVSSFLYATYAYDPYVNDGNMFYYMGMMLAYGKTPYLEVFDHKGLYLFYYCALGVVLGGRVAFFFIQSIVLGLTYFFMLLALRELKANKIMIATSMLVFFGVYAFSMQSPADYEIQLPFISVMIYFYMRGIAREDDKSYFIGNIFAGLCAGVAINVRASDAMVPFAFVVAFLCYSIKNKKYKQLLFNALACVGALVLACIPPLIHSLIGGFTKEMYQTILLDNFTYVGTSKDRFDSSPLLCRIILLVLAVFYFVPLLMNRKKMMKDEFMIYLSSGLVLFIIQFVIAFYPHYIFIMLPFLFVIIFRCTSLYFDEPKKWHAVFAAVAGAFAIGGACFYPISYYTTVYPMCVQIKKEIDAHIPVEDQRNGRVLGVDALTGIYPNTEIIIGYGDFGVQNNHVMLSSLYSYDHFVEYMKSGQCKYVISTKDYEINSGFKAISWFNTEEGKTYFTRQYYDDLELLEIFIYTYEG